MAGLPSEEADRLLDWCEEMIAKTGRPRTIRELREECDRRRMLEPNTEFHQLSKRTRIGGQAASRHQQQTARRGAEDSIGAGPIRGRPDHPPDRGGGDAVVKCIERNSAVS
jgi:hypothetical protein